MPGEQVLRHHMALTNLESGTPAPDGRTRTGGGCLNLYYSSGFRLCAQQRTGSLQYGRTGWCLTVAR
jgi:hypothetical protein